MQSRVQKIVMNRLRPQPNWSQLVPLTVVCLVETRCTMLYTSTRQPGAFPRDGRRGRRLSGTTEIRRTVHFSWRLSRLTCPHQLVPSRFYGGRGSVPRVQLGVTGGDLFSMFQPTSTPSDIFRLSERTMSPKKASSEECAVSVRTIPGIAILCHTLVQDEALAGGFELQFFDSGTSYLIESRQG